jgi:hypothetical protein
VAILEKSSVLRRISFIRVVIIKVGLEC